LSGHCAQIVWNRRSSDFTYASYNREHECFIANSVLTEVSVKSEPGA